MIKGKAPVSAAAPRSSAAASSRTASSSTSAATGAKTTTTTTASGAPASKPARVPISSRATSSSSSSVNTGNNANSNNNNNNNNGEDSGTEKKKSGMFTERPSARLDRNRAVDPFATKTRYKSSFSQAYAAGSIPAHIMHGSVRSSISWDGNIEDVDYTSVFVKCAEGLVETDHPYIFVAPRAFTELCKVPGSERRIVPILAPVAAAFRTLFAQPNVGDENFLNGLQCLQDLSDTVGQYLNPYLNLILTPLCRRMFAKTSSAGAENRRTNNASGASTSATGLLSVQAKKKAEKTSNAGQLIMDVLQKLELNGGPEALQIIKSKVPTYTTALL